MTAANKLVPANFGQGCFGQAAAIVSAISHPTLVYRMYDCMDTLQQQSKVCIQTFALLYIAAFPCIPNCLGIKSQLITGNYVSNSFDQSVQGPFGLGRTESRKNNEQPASDSDTSSSIDSGHNTN